jgi:hypothetical protein
MGSKSSQVRITGRAGKSGASITQYQWECPYCKGHGIDPYNLAGIKNCPACHGHIFWESETKCTDLEGCHHCDGSGKTNFQGQWMVCPHCSGAGRT